MPAWRVARISTAVHTAVGLVPFASGQRIETTITTTADLAMTHSPRRGSETTSSCMGTYVSTSPSATSSANSARWTSQSFCTINTKGRTTPPVATTVRNRFPY